jgi:TonB family protein
MRRVLTLAILTALGGAALAGAARAEPPTPDPALAVYPAAARAAGIEGSATLTCTRNAHMALTGCVVAAETPAGQGFGQAALALAALSPDNPSLDVRNPHLVAPQSVTVAFRLHPPSVDPDLSQMAHIITNPSVLRAPTPEDLWAYYPAAAYRALVSGHVTLQCDASADGRLAGCAVTEETPRGRHFGDAALKLAKLYSVSPMKRDGVPIEGAKVQAPVDFDASAAAFVGLAHSAAPAEGVAATDVDLAAPPRHWLSVPSDYDIARVYPDRATRAFIWGHVVLQCTVAGDGALQGCAVAAEGPADWGFGAAALALVPRFRLDVTAPLGDPAAVGARITVPIGFKIAERCDNCQMPGR